MSDVAECRCRYIRSGMHGRDRSAVTKKYVGCHDNRYTRSRYNRSTLYITCFVRTVLVEKRCLYVLFLLECLSAP